MLPVRSLGYIDKEKSNTHAHYFDFVVSLGLKLSKVIIQNVR